MTEDPAVMEAMLHDLYVDKPHQMTLLDHFAQVAMGRFMEALLTDGPDLDFSTDPETGAKTVVSEGGQAQPGLNFDWVAGASYEMAEAMIRERAKRLSRQEDQPS